MSPARWLKQRILTQDEATITSLGELLLPTLLGAMEACWVDAILLGLASLGVLNLSVPLLPLWAPFVYIVGSQWALALFEQRGKRIVTSDSTTGGDVQDSEGGEGGTDTVKASDATVFFALTAIIALFVIWLQLYASTFPLYNLLWLGTLVSDILFLNLHFYQAIFIVALSFYLSWRGLRLVGHIVEPSQVMRWLLLGLAVMIGVILLRAALQSAGGTNFQDTVLLFLFIPLLLFLGLSAHALARIVFIRKTHYSGLQGSVLAQERAVMTVIGSLGVLLLFVTLVVGLSASPAFFSGAVGFLAVIGHTLVNAYNWLVSALADVFVVLVTPIFWLISLISSLFPHKASSTQTPPSKLPKKQPKVTPTSNAAFDTLLPILKVVVPMLLLLLVLGLVWLALRRRRKIPLHLSRLDEDLHESLWSWLLLWSQLKAMLRAFFGRLFPRGAVEEQARLVAGESVADPVTRDIREMYRALLKKAAGRGYARKRDETPLEFRQRLDEQVPVVEPQLEAITEAYSLVRYGGATNEVDVAAVRGQWSELDQKWV